MGLCCSSSVPTPWAGTSFWRQQPSSIRRRNRQQNYQAQAVLQHPISSLSLHSSIQSTGSPLYHIRTRRLIAAVFRQFGHAPKDSSSDILTNDCHQSQPDKRVLPLFLNPSSEKLQMLASKEISTLCPMDLDHVLWGNLDEGQGQ